MKRVGLGTAIALLFIVGWVGSGPFRTVDGINKAVRTNDMELLSRNVNFPTLRENLKAQMGDAITRRLDKQNADNPLKILGAAVASMVSGSVVDTLVTPEGIGTLLQGKGLEWRERPDAQERGEHADDTGKAPSHKKPARSTSWTYRSPSEFVLKVQRGKKLTSFIVTRDGLSWQLTNIVLPVD